MKYQVSITRSDEGSSVSCPALPGCWSQGKTEKEALSNIKAAISEYLMVVSESIPADSVREVEVPA